jgi:tetratricopeptide (TPR) repeat protein
MSALARIRKTALQHEQERQYDKALALYARLLDGAEAGEEEVDVALFNRAGDLALRTGDTPRALGYFERALDLYAAGGLLNNAVALGVKILRHAPGHLSAHYTLGVLYSRKGFAGDARHHLLTYAVQMQRAGRADEARRVLAEVAAGCLDAAERRVALDAYGALGGDPAQAATLAEALVAPAAATAVAPGVEPAAVAWGAVDFDAAAPADASATAPWATSTPLSVAGAGAAAHPEVSGVGADLRLLASGEPDALGAGSAALIDFEPAVDHADAPAPVWLDVVADAGATHALPTADYTPVPAAAVKAGEPAMFDLESPEPRVGASDGTPQWPNQLDHDEPAPLRLAELLRLDEPGEAEWTPDVARARDSDGSWGTVWTPADASGADAEWEIPTSRGAEPAFEPTLEPAFEPAADRALDPPREHPLGLVGEDALADAYDVALELPPVGWVARSDVATEGVAPGDPATADPAAASAAAEDGLDLGAWLRDDDEPATTRLTTAVVPQTGDEQADFDATLRAFTRGVERAVGHEDWDSHYDLGVAFREMGLVEEAIVEFQRAARAPGSPLRTLEALAQCFLDMRQPELALSTLERPATAAAREGAGDAALVGVHYLMGAAAQALGRPDDARHWLVRVVATDVRFRDAATRLAALPPPNPVR